MSCLSRIVLGGAVARAAAVAITAALSVAGAAKAEERGGEFAYEFLFTGNQAVSLRYAGVRLPLGISFDETTLRRMLPGYSLEGFLDEGRPAWSVFAPAADGSRESSLDLYGTEDGKRLGTISGRGGAVGGVIDGSSATMGAKLKGLYPGRTAACGAIWGAEYSDSAFFCQSPSSSQIYYLVAVDSCSSSIDLGDYRATRKHPFRLRPIAIDECMSIKGMFIGKPGP